MAAMVPGRCHAHVVHELAAAAHDAKRIHRLEHAGCHQRGEFSQAVSRDKAGLDAALAEDSKHDQAVKQYRRFARCACA